MPRLGGPEVLTVQPWPIPVPGPDEVRIRVEAAGISFADLLVMQGVHPERRQAAVRARLGRGGGGRVGGISSLRCLNR